MAVRAAVSDRRMRGPIDIGLNPQAAAWPISASLRPPSGPTSSSTVPDPGSPVTLTMVPGAYYVYAERVNLGVVRKDENALWSLAPHDISMILHLVETEPTSVSARGACYLQQNVEDVVFGELFDLAGLADRVLDQRGDHREIVRRLRLQLHRQRIGIPRILRLFWKVIPAQRQH